MGFMEEKCQRYLQLLDELDHFMKQTSNVGGNMGERIVDLLDWRIASLLSEIQQLEKVIMEEAI